jgi:hypothetical protein
LNGMRRLTELNEDPRLKTRIKVENFVLVHLGLRPCSQTTFPVDLPGAEEMGSTIDGMMSPKMGQIRHESDPRRRLLAIASLKKEMREAYNMVVKGSEQYEAHLEWAGALRLKTRVVDVRPTVQELYTYKERRLGGELRRLMKDREKIRRRAYTSAYPGMDRARLAYPEEFEGSWLREMGKTLGYPECCVDAYASDREGGFSVEERAARQLEEAEGMGEVNPLAYFVGYFFPCSPDCEAALFKGKECLSRLIDLDPSWGDIYSHLVAENLENVRRQPEIIAKYQARAQGDPSVSP